MVVWTIKNQTVIQFATYDQSNDTNSRRVFYRKYRYATGAWCEWQEISVNIPSFYKNYNDLASLASALRVNPPIIGDLAHKDSGSVKLNANYGNTYHVYITKYVSGADQLILGEYLVSFGNSGYLITLKEKTGELSTVNIENDGTVTATFSSEGYYRIRCLKR